MTKRLSCSSADDLVSGGWLVFPVFQSSLLAATTRDYVIRTDVEITQSSFAVWGITLMLGGASSGYSFRESSLARRHTGRLTPEFQQKDATPHLEATYASGKTSTSSTTGRELCLASDTRTCLVHHPSLDATG